MKLFLLLSLLSFAAGPASVSFEIPEQYQGGSDMIVHVVDGADVSDYCGRAPKGYIILACANPQNVHELAMPNPCLYPEVKDENSYAHLFCHEKAHSNGWVHRGV